MAQPPIVVETEGLVLALEKRSAADAAQAPFGVKSPPSSGGGDVVVAVPPAALGNATSVQAREPAPPPAPPITHPA